jgi:hypothetical protein
MPCVRVLDQGLDGGALGAGHPNQLDQTGEIDG